MLSDLRYALRTLRQSRGFTSAAVLALALGIGANTAMFSIVYSVLLKPLPYRQPDRLVWLTQSNKRFQAEIVIAPDFLDWRSQSRSFDPLAACFASDRTLTNLADPMNIRVTELTEPVGRILGVQPAIGRDFLPQELQPGAGSRAALISDHFFHSFFHGDRAALGASLTFGDEIYTVIGVMPPGFRLALPSPFGPQSESEAILAYVMNPADHQRGARGMSIVQVVGRLRPGVSVAAARAEIAAIEARIPQPPFVHTGEQELIVQPLRDRLLGNRERPLVILLGAVAFVLMIACANVANLLLARAAGRQREIAVRMALGASRARLIRQALTESLLLGLAGGIAGLLLAAWWLRLIVNWNAVIVPRLKDASLDPVVLAFAFAISLLTGVVFGIAPAIAAAGANVNEALKSAATAPGRRRLRGILVIAEVALSLVLLAGAGLMIKSLWLMRAAASPEAPEQVLTATLQISNPRFRDPVQADRIIAGYLSRIQSIPGVRAASAGGAQGSALLQLEGSTAEPVRTDFFNVTPRFFTAAGLRLVKGRLLSDGDRADAPTVAVINETFARRLLPSYPRETLVGRRIPMFSMNSPANQREPVEIVGVVADFRGSRLDAPVAPQMFRSAAQTTWRGGIEILVRAISDPTALTGAIRMTGRADGIALLHPETMADRLEASIAPRRFEMTLLIVFASLALLLAVVGIYGVVAFMVAQRTREIGVRVALGAQRRDVVGLMLGSGLRLVAAGVVFGLAAALALARLMQTFLYGVKATDAMTLAASSIVLVSVAALASWIPARRAAGVDPLAALRHD